MSLVSVEEQQRYMSNMRMTTDQVESLTDLLVGIQAELEMYIMRVLEPRVVREAATADEKGYLNLTFTPVVAVNRIQAGGGAYALSTPTELWPVGTTPPEYGDKPIIDYIPAGHGSDKIVPGGYYLGIPNQRVLIEYVSAPSGFVGAYIDAAKQAIKRVAARDFEIMHDSTMALNKQAAVPEDFTRRTPRGWTEQELRRFDRIRRRVIL